MKCPECNQPKSTVEIVCTVTHYHYEHDDGSEEGPWFDEDSDCSDRVRPIYIPKNLVHTCMDCGHTFTRSTTKPLDPKHDEDVALENFLKEAEDDPDS